MLHRNPYGTHKLMSSVASHNVKKELQDPMQDLMKAIQHDSTPGKIDLGAGVYRNEQGMYHEFETIRHAKARLDAMNLGHDYNPTTGIQTFTERAANLVFGPHNRAINENRVASIQTVGGTGGNRIGPRS